MTQVFPSPLPLEIVKDEAKDSSTWVCVTEVWVINEKLEIIYMSSSGYNKSIQFNQESQSYRNLFLDKERYL